MVIFRFAAAITHQAARRGERAILENRRHRVSDGQRGQTLAPAPKERAGPITSPPALSVEPSLQILHRAHARCLPAAHRGAVPRVRAAAWKVTAKTQWVRAGVGWIDQHGKQKSPSAANSCISSSRFGSHLHIQVRHAGQIAAGPIQAGHQSGLDRIDCYSEHDRNCCCGRVGCHRPRSAARRYNQSDLATHQIGCKRRQSVIMTFGPPVFDVRRCDPRRIRRLSIPLETSAYEFAHISGEAPPRKPITGLPRCCARTASGQAAAVLIMAIKARRLIRPPSEWGLLMPRIVRAL